MKILQKTAVAILLSLGVLAVSSQSLYAECAVDLKRYSIEEYNKLKKAQAAEYWKEIEASLKKWKDAGMTSAEAAKTIQAEIDQLKTKVKDTEAETVKYELICLDKEVSKLEKLSFDELTANEAKIGEYEGRLREIKGLNGADSPENKDKIAGLEKRLNQLRENLKLPTTWTVQKGEYLYKISGYPQIYGDPLKWPRIYRANRDLIKNPNLIYPGWVLKIPRGVINSWTVFKGETLAKIAGYNEVYSKRSEWTKIYEANKDKVKDPNMVYPKQVLTIPR